MKEINVKSLICYFKRYVIIFIVGIIISVIIGGYYASKVQEEVYVTTTSIGLTFNNNDKDNVYLNRENFLINQSLANEYIQILKQTDTLNQLKELAKVDYSVAELEQMISTELLADSTIINITVQAKEPEETVIMARELIGILQEKVNRVYKLDNIKVLNPANTPTDSVKTSLIKVIFIFVFATVIIIALIVFVIFYIKYDPYLEQL